MSDTTDEEVMEQHDLGCEDSVQNMDEINQMRANRKAQRS